MSGMFFLTVWFNPFSFQCMTPVPAYIKCPLFSQSEHNCLIIVKHAGIERLVCIKLLIVTHLLNGVDLYKCPSARDVFTQWGSF